MLRKLLLSFCLALLQHLQPCAAQTGSRWYSHFQALDTAFFSSTNGIYYTVPLWSDSTLRMRTAAGLVPVRFSAVSQHFDPVNAPLFNAPQLYAGQIEVRATDAYRIDSIRIDAVYQRVKPAVNDTLILSVSVSGGYWRYDSLTSQLSPVAGPAPTAASPNVCPMYAPLHADSVNRAAFSPGNAQRQLWRVVLTAADSSSGRGKTYYYKLPAPLSLAAGQQANITLSFKSGDSWVPNADSLAQHNHWKAFCGAHSPNFTSLSQLVASLPPQADHNMSGFLPAAETGGFYPSYYLFPQTGPQFVSMGIHVTGCATCPLLRLSQGVLEPGEKPMAVLHPNPADGLVRIRLQETVPGPLRLFVFNALGQPVLKEQLSNLTAGQELQTRLGGLPGGLYRYQLLSGERQQAGSILLRH